jgi:hypothetical protein
MGTNVLQGEPAGVEEDSVAGLPANRPPTERKECTKTRRPDDLAITTRAPSSTPVAGQKYSTIGVRVRP